MTITLRGFRHMDYTNKEGRRVQGTSLFYTFPMSGEGANGEEGEGKFVSVSNGIVLPPLAVGNAYSADFSNKGHLLGLTESKGSK